MLGTLRAPTKPGFSFVHAPVIPLRTIAALLHFEL